MRPCDCRDDVTALKLNEQGIGINDTSIEVRYGRVKLTVGSCRVFISMREFRHIAEWYLKDQNETD